MMICWKEQHHAKSLGFDEVEGKIVEEKWVFSSASLAETRRAGRWRRGEAEGTSSMKGPLVAACFISGDILSSSHPVPPCCAQHTTRAERRRYAARALCCRTRSRLGSVRRPRLGVSRCRQAAGARLVCHSAMRPTRAHATRAPTRGCALRSGRAVRCAGRAASLTDSFDHSFSVATAGMRARGMPLPARA